MGAVKTISDQRTKPDNSNQGLAVHFKILHLNSLFNIPFTKSILPLFRKSINKMSLNPYKGLQY